MMVMFEGRMMSTDEVLSIRNSKNTVIETPSDKSVKTPKEAIKEEIVESPKEETQKVVADELEEARLEYKIAFGRKPSPNTKLETIRNKLLEANEA